jgi:hypothetical protein
MSIEISPFLETHDAESYVLGLGFLPRFPPSCCGQERLRGLLVRSGGSCSGTNGAPWLAASSPAYKLPVVAQGCCFGVNMSIRLG